MSSDYNTPRDVTEFVEPAGTSGKAIGSLVCGALSFVCNIFTGIPAIVLGILSLGDIARSEGRLGGRGLAIAGIVTGCIGSTFITVAVLVALLLPAVQAARDTGRRTVSGNNLHHIAIALLNYESQHRKFPPAITTDENGRPMHSWRVHILPYLELADLHAKYKFDEPWDSPNNKTVLSAMPLEFALPGQGGPGVTTTNVVAIVGEETVWSRAGVGLDELAAADGASNTLLLVEVANMNIPWTEPRDITIDEFCKGINKPGGPQDIYRGGVVAFFADGHMRFISEDVSPEVLRALVTKAGGEPIDESVLDR